MYKQMQYYPWIMEKVQLLLHNTQQYSPEMAYAI